MAEKGKLSKSDIESQAIAIVKDEIDNYEDGVTFITEKVAFAMRPLIRTLRKNYWGIFDEEIDPTTGRKKIWVPLSANIVDATRKLVDLDAKDMNFRSKHKDGYAITDILRTATHEWMEDTYFGEELNETITPFCIDGTTVWKTWEGKDENGKPTVERRTVDLLNVYIDPTADDIQSAYRFTERAVMNKQNIMAMTGWINTEDAEPQTGLNPNDPKMDMSSRSVTTKGIEVFEMWGKIPKSLITGEAKDKDTEVDGHIVVSGIRGKGNSVVHLIEQNVNKDKEGKVIKPYEEARYMKVPGRWYGVGPTEKVMMLQLWINTIVNIRINRSYVSQLGIFKVRSGSGISPRQLQRLSANGVVKVKSMDDIEQLVMQEASQASYADEENVVSWAQRVTSALDVVTGTPLPASTTATGAAIQDRNTKDAFTIVKESLGSFLQRWYNRHALPIVAKGIKKGKDAKVLGIFDNAKELRERIVASKAIEEVEKLWKEGIVPTTDELNQAFTAAEETLAKDEDITVEVLHDIIVKGIDAKFFVTNEEMDVGVTMNNLVNMLQVAPEFKSLLVPQVMDLMGLKVPTQSELREAQEREIQAQQQQAQPTEKDLQQLTTSANTFQG